MVNFFRNLSQNSIRGSCITAVMILWACWYACRFIESRETCAAKDGKLYLCKQLHVKYPRRFLCLPMISQNQVIASEYRFYWVDPHTVLYGNKAHLFALLAGMCGTQYCSYKWKLSVLFRRTVQWVGMIHYGTCFLFGEWRGVWSGMKGSQIFQWVRLMLLESAHTHAELTFNICWTTSQAWPSLSVSLCRSFLTNG
jgi:hypothetical protein